MACSPLLQRRAAELDEVFSSASLHIVPLLECRTQGDGFMRGSHYTMYKTSADVLGLDGTQICIYESHEICHGICSHQPTHAAHHVVYRWQNIHIISAHAATECADPWSRMPFGLRLICIFCLVCPVAPRSSALTPMQQLDPLFVTALVLSPLKRHVSPFRVILPPFGFCACVY